MAETNLTDADGNRSFETNPVVVVQGVGRHVTREDGPGAASLRRAQDRDLFR